MRLAVEDLCSGLGPELRVHVASRREGLELTFWACIHAFPFWACVLSCP